MTTASSLQYETIFSRSFPAEAASAHSISRLNNLSCSAAGSKRGGEQLAATRIVARARSTRGVDMYRASTKVKSCSELSASAAYGSRLSCGHPGPLAHLSLND